ncbi:hypothetical protein [Niveibacterium terrae]|uniref:hypothetical protein n=1 Tax=Niveibacterium terrae TaxID=3373598 RepID=UPI003A942CD0
MNLSLALLVLINLLCALLHAVFQFSLLSFEGGLRGFLLTENIVIAFVFVGFSWALSLGSPSVRQAALSASIFFWGAFMVFVLAIRPTETTLELVRGLLFLPQYCYLFLFGAMALALSIANHRKALLADA